jgi:DNA (cytosine-5)-methyltransferase 1
MGLRPRLLDLFCGAGGAAMGYHRAGFEVIGVDIVPQPRFPFEFHQADAMTFPLDGYDVIHASPPCQRYSGAQRIRDREHPDLLWRIQARLVGRRYVIENVVGAPLHNPIMLCGAMFGLKTYRHRLFESSLSIRPKSPHPPHIWPQTKMGRKPKAGEFIHVVGNFSGVALAREAMDTPWMTRDEMREAIPPAYTEWIGQQLLDVQRIAA